MPDINGIPYVDSSDLVSAYPAVSLALATELDDQLGSKLDTTAYTAPGLVLIAAESFSAVSSVSVNGCFSAAYDNYQIAISFEATSGIVGVTYRLRASGTDNSTSNYHNQNVEVASTSVTGSRSASATAATVVDARVQRAVSQIWINGPFLAATKVAHSLNVSYAAGLLAQTFINHTTNSIGISSSFDGITFIATGGTITGTLRIYGYKNS